MSLKMDNNAQESGTSTTLAVVGMLVVLVLFSLICLGIQTEYTTGDPAWGGNTFILVVAMMIVLAGVITMVLRG